MTMPFFIKDCALAVIATGEIAESMVQFKEVLRRIPLNSIYYHFWGSRLRSTVSPPQFVNDLAHWAHIHLHDDVLSEKLGILDPVEYAGLEDLRKAILEIFEEHLDEIEYMLWSKKESRFYFLRSNIVIFDTAIQADHPSDLKKIIPALTPSSIFYHFIDARTRTENAKDDFSCWLATFKDDYPALIEKIQRIDPYFLSLTEIRQKLSEVINAHFA